MTARRIQSLAYSLRRIDLETTAGPSFFVDITTAWPYKTVMQAVIETADYLRDAKAVGLSEAELADIVTLLAKAPRSGDLIVGSGGARKVRFARPGHGKSGGYRVITYFGGADIPVFLLNVFSKGDTANLTKAERNELRAILSQLRDRYLERISQHVKSR